MFEANLTGSEFFSCNISIASFRELNAQISIKLATSVQIKIRENFHHVWFLSLYIIQPVQVWHLQLLCKTQGVASFIMKVLNML